MSIRKTAFEALKTKFEGIDESVLSRVASSMSKTAKTEDDILAKVEDITLQGVINSYTDSRVSDASEKAVKTYEERFGLKDGRRAKSAEDKGGDDGADKSEANGGDEDVPNYARSLMDALTSMKAEIAEMKAGKSAEKRKATFEKLIENAPERTQKALKREFSRSTFKDDDDFASWIDEITPEVSDATENATAKSAIVGKPKGGGGVVTKGVNPLVQARIDSRLQEAATAPSAIKGMPNSNN